MTPPAAVLPRLVTRPPPLSGLMHIRPVSLRHRNMSLLHQSDRVEEILSRLSIHHHNNHTTTTTTAINHLQPSDPGLHNYYPRLPSLPYSPPVAGVGSSGYRGLYSGRVGPLNASRRPQQLRPIEHPRTPALERIESAQIRGYRLPVNAASGAGVVGLLAFLYLQSIPSQRCEGSPRSPSATLVLHFQSCRSSGDSSCPVAEFDPQTSSSDLPPPPTTSELIRGSPSARKSSQIQSHMVEEEEEER
ncbi:hypothetical protein GBAR_LOCUS7096 [Geodia barretti]|nr:hypothetical protein GBAR_LOCUS7096 [Geodia barretti]